MLICFALQNALAEMILNGVEWDLPGDFGRLLLSQADLAQRIALDGFKLCSSFVKMARAALELKIAVLVLPRLGLEAAVAAAGLGAVLRLVHILEAIAGPVHAGEVAISGFVDLGDGLAARI